VFTGLIREIGTVESIDRDATGARIRVGASLAAELRDGDSVAVTGACLTLAARADRAFEADVMNQTLSLTTLGDLEPGAAVNLEPALRAGEPLGGHFVQGHVDGTGEVLASSEDGFSRRIRVAVPAELGRYLVEHGSVAVDGVSLTVAALDDTGFEVMLIPHTLEVTNLGRLTRGRAVNIETDVIGKYVQRSLAAKGA
jgi:riboflavin synthase alpha subunit